MNHKCRNNRNKTYPKDPKRSQKPISSPRHAGHLSAKKENCVCFVRPLLGLCITENHTESWANVPHADPLRSGELKRNMPRIIDEIRGNFHKIQRFPPSRRWNRSHGGWPGDPDGWLSDSGFWLVKWDIRESPKFVAKAEEIMIFTDEIYRMEWGTANFWTNPRNKQKIWQSRAPFISNPLVWEVVPIGFGRFTWLGLAENPNEISWIQQIRVRDPTGPQHEYRFNTQPGFQGSEWYLILGRYHRDEHPPSSHWNPTFLTPSHRQIVRVTAPAMGNDSCVGGFAFGTSAAPSWGEKNWGFHHEISPL